MADLKYNPQKMSPSGVKLEHDKYLRKNKDISMLVVQVCILASMLSG